MAERYNVKRIEIAEFREFGYLHEVNRLFLHPLGLALEVVIEKDGSEHLGGVWDDRSDPEGWTYGEDLLDPEKVRRVEAELRSRADARWKKLGYIVQPVDGRNARLRGFSIGDLNGLAAALADCSPGTVGAEMCAEIETERARRYEAGEV